MRVGSWVIVAALTGVGALSAPEARAQDNFYAGRVVTFIVGTGPGGGVDLYGRVLSQFMAQYIPGKPTLVVQNMPGAGGVAATNHMYNVALKDGSVIATIPSSAILAEALDSTGVQFESMKLSWIGTIAPTTDVLAVWKTTGIATLDDARRKTAIVGAVNQYGLAFLEPGLANALLGTKFRVVTGYSEAGDSLNLAMERNETDGRTNQWSSWKGLRPDWIRDNKLSYILQFGPRVADLPDVPALGELVTDPDDKAIVNVLEVAQYAGRCIFAPPGVPPARLQILRDAFNATMHDEGFIAKLAQAGLDMDPRSGDETQKAIVKAMTNRDAVVTRMKSKLGLK